MLAEVRGVSYLRHFICLPIYAHVDPSIWQRWDMQDTKNLWEFDTSSRIPKLFESPGVFWKKIAQKYIFHFRNWFYLQRSHWFNYPFSGLCLFMRLPCSSYLWVKTPCFLQICGSLSWCHRNVRWLPDRNSTKEGTYVQWIHYHLVNSIKWPTRVQ